jgi:RNA polymerase sigma-70 factor (ECF subfamily)
MEDVFDQKGGWRLSPARWRFDPTKLLEQKAFYKTLKQCLSQLTGRLANAFMLREMEGLSTDEICKVLNISSTNMWVMLHRARMSMRRCLEINWFNIESSED